jgi:hypothetical protein
MFEAGKHAVVVLLGCLQMIGPTGLTRAPAPATCRGNQSGVRPKLLPAQLHAHCCTNGRHHAATSWQLT